MSEALLNLNDPMRNDAIRKYAQNLINIKPDFLRMVYDTYSGFDLEELERLISESTNPDEEIINNKTIIAGIIPNDKNKKNKGFFNSIEEFLKGFDYDKITRNIKSVLQKINNNALNIVEDKTIPEIKNLSFIKNEDLPKKPQKKFLNTFSPSTIQETVSSIQPKKTSKSLQGFYERKESEKEKLLNFNFKRNVQKFLTFTSVATIQQDRVSEYIDDIVVNKNVAQVLKLVDYNTDNRIVFIDKIATDEKGVTNINPVLKHVDLESLDDRAYIITHSRMNYISKTALIVNKFITSLKKICKNKKEKENKKEVNFYTNNLINKDMAKIERSASQNSLHSTENITHFNGKFRKEDKDLISSRSINVFSSTKQMDIRIIKKLLANKNKDRGEQNKKQKLLNIKEKALNLLRQKREEEIGKSMGESMNRSEFDEHPNEDDGFDDNFNYDNQGGIQDEDNLEGYNNGIIERRKLKRRSTIGNQYYNIGLVEEKILNVRPKKKVNILGLKLFITEEMSKANSMKKK